MSYFERVPVGVENVERDFDVLLDALASPLELPALQGQIQVIASVAWNNYTRQMLIKKEVGKLFMGRREALSSCVATISRQTHKSVRS